MSFKCFKVQYFNNDDHHNSSMMLLNYYNNYTKNQVTQYERFVNVDMNTSL